MKRYKAFEARFESEWSEAIKDGFIYRLNDQVSGYYGTSRNISDYICYVYPNLYLIDCKVHEKNTLPWSAISQLDEMEKYLNIPGVYPGIVWWAVDHDKILWIPASYLSKLRKDGNKSFNINKDMSDEVVEIPTKKLRVYLKGDYSIFKSLYQE